MEIKLLRKKKNHLIKKTKTSWAWIWHVLWKVYSEHWWGKSSLKEPASRDHGSKQKDSFTMECDQPVKGVTWCAYDSSKCNSAGNTGSRLMTCSDGFQHIQSLISQMLQVWQTIEQAGHQNRWLSSWNSSVALLQMVMCFPGLFPYKYTCTVSRSVTVFCFSGSVRLTVRLILLEIEWLTLKAKNVEFEEWVNIHS